MENYISPIKAIALAGGIALGAIIASYFAPKSLQPIMNPFADPAFLQTDAKDYNSRRF